MKVIFNPYCSLATSGFSEMKVKTFRFIVKGRGMMSVMKTTISKTRRAKTWGHVCQYCSGYVVVFEGEEYRCVDEGWHICRGALVGAVCEDVVRDRVDMYCAVVARAEVLTRE